MARRASINTVKDNFGPNRSNIEHKGRSDDQTLRLSGKGTPGKEINIYDNNKLIGTVTVNKKGRWSFTTEPLDHGQHSFVAATVKANGNLANKSSKYSVFVDTKANALNNAELTENDNSYLIKGRAEGFATVRIYDNGKEIGQVKANKQGYYRFEMDKDMAAGEHAITLTQQDVAGNLSKQSKPQMISIGQSEPATTLEKPTVDSGEFDGHAFLIGGTVVMQAGATFTITVNGQSYTQENGLIIEGNKWSLAIDASGWSDGQYDVVATLSNGSETVQDSSLNEISYSRAGNIGLAGIDSDGDEVPDDIDIDDDNDGILDVVEGTGDLDKDGIINALDLDSDGDGIADNIEAQSTNGFKDPIVFIDRDFDGLHDFYDADTSDQSAEASKGIAVQDTDKDRQADYLDFDSDNDSLLDISESGIPFDDFSTDYRNITGGFLPDDLADTFGTDERDYRESNGPANRPIGPVKDIDSTFNQVLEGSAAGTEVGLHADAKDPDSGDTVSYELINDAQGRFAIDAKTGIVTLVGKVDHSQASQHQIEVQANSSDGSFSTKKFTIQVVDDNNPIGPVNDIDSDKNSVSETAKVNSTVGVQGHAIDPDAGDKVSYSLFDDAGGRFKINSKTGVVTLAKEVDYSVAKSHDITIKAESSDGTVSAETFTIQVEQNKPIGPVKDSDKADNAVSECADENSYVGITALAIDPDTAGDVFYELLDDAGGRFKIDSSSGEVFTTDVHLDYETQSSHDIVIKATSPDGSSSQKTMTIDVLDAETYVKFNAMPTYDIGKEVSEPWFSYANAWPVPTTGFITPEGAIVTVSGTSNAPAGTILTIKEVNSLFADPKAAYDESWDRQKTQYHTAVVKSDGTFSVEVNIADAPPVRQISRTDPNFVWEEPDGNSVFSISDITLPAGTHVCDLNTGSTTLTITNSMTIKGNSPLVLDLNGDGVQTTVISQDTRFDIDADGELEAVGWASKDDALLAFDINQDGIINNGSELFGEETLLEDGSKAEEGFQALSALDTNQDGVFNAEDQSYDKLQLWQDHNQNGISEQGELISLAEAGVASINLNATAIAESNNENHIGLRSSWTDTDGNQHDIDDVWFNTLDSNGGIIESDLLSDDSHEIEGLGDQAEYAQGASSNEAPIASAEFIQADDLLLEQLSNNGSNVCYF